MPTQAEPHVSEDFALVVCSGLHAGATVGLSEGRYIIGSGAEADILLSDHGIAAAHLELFFRRAGCSLRCLGGGIVVSGRKLTVGARAAAELPVDIDIGPVRLTVRATAAPALLAGKPRLPRRHRALLVGLGGGVVAACLALVALNHTGPADANSSTAAAKMPIPLHTNSGPPPGSQAGAPAAEPSGNGAGEQASAALMAQIRQAGLAGLVSLHPLEGVIEARGSVKPEDEAAWVRIQSWFDEAYRGRIVLLPRVKVEAGATAIPRFSIQGIWAGPAPYVIGGNGEKFGEGAHLPGGWQIISIKRDSVVVSRQGERVSLTP